MGLNLLSLYEILSPSSKSLGVDLSPALLEAEFDFKVKIKKSLRARRITLRICQVTGGLRVTIPSNLKASVLRDFIKKNINWVRFNLKNLSPSISVTEGIRIPISGQYRTILIDNNLQAKYLLKETELIVPKTKVRLEIQVKTILKQMAEDYFRVTCNDYAKKLDVKFLKISLKDPRSRWGSCSSEKKLMFSWRLIMAPVEVSSYVAAHEMAHLLHMDHSQRFWTVVGSIYQNYGNQRNWLKENGRSLHKFVF